MLSVISNVDYNILYFFKLPSKSIISLLFGELLNIDYCFTFLGIASQPCSLRRGNRAQAGSALYAVAYARGGGGFEGRTPSIND